MRYAGFNIRNKVIDLTSDKILPVIDNVYKESLRAMLYAMGDVYYIDGNHNRVNITCTHGNPERMASRLMADNTMVLPLITVNEVSTGNSDERRRHNNTIVAETVWDASKRRATRVVSLPPRPINITYEVNIWTKYRSDMDMVRASVFAMFNPDMEVVTEHSEFSKAFLVDERDLGSLTAEDGSDRLLQKTFTVELETYIPSPRFQITNTGELNEIKFNVTVDSNTPQEAAEEVIVTPFDKAIPVIPEVPDNVPFAPYFFGGEEVDNVTSLEPKVHYSVTTGEWPLVVQATVASSVNAPAGTTGASGEGLSDPFHQADYHWNFGDTTRPNTDSTLGINLKQPQNNAGRQWMFVDLGRQRGGRSQRSWSPENSSDPVSYVGLDSLGNISSIEVGSKAVSYINQGHDQYPEGVYTAYWDGSGQLEWDLGASAIENTSTTWNGGGKMKVNVDHSEGSGIIVRVDSIAASNPLKNLRIIMPGFEKSAKWRTQPFHPLFLERLKHFSPLRLMDMCAVNNSEISSWSERTTLDHATQSASAGCSYEYMVQLANTLKADPWFCIPHLADKKYITNMANLIANSLDKDLKCYIEYSNECWNFSFDQAGYCFSAGALEHGEYLFSNYDANATNYGLTNQQQRGVRCLAYGQRSVSAFDIFETAFSGTDRIVRVMADQRGNFPGHNEMLSGVFNPNYSEADPNPRTVATTNYEKVDKFAVNAYFGSQVKEDLGPIYTTDNPGITGCSALSGYLYSGTIDDGIDNLLTYYTSAITQTFEACDDSYETVSAAPYYLSGTKFISYEAGQHLTDCQAYSDTVIADMYASSFRDPRMKDVYFDLLDRWYTDRGWGNINLFNYVDRWNKTNRWGHLEYQDQPLSAAPKFEALVDWAQMNTSAHGSMGLMYHGKTGETMWTNDSQIGPQAAHVYYRPGTYNASCTMIVQDSSGDQMASTVVSTITVTDNFSAMWFDSVSGDDGNDGLGASAPKQSISSLGSWMDSRTDDNRRAYVKRGSTWYSVSDASPITNRCRVRGIGRRIVPYGSGTMPEFIAGEEGSPYLATMPILHSTNGSGKNELDDFALVGVSMNANNQVNNAFNSGSPNKRDGVSVIDCYLASSVKSTLQVDNDGASRVAIINCELNHASGASQGASIKLEPLASIDPNSEFLSVIGVTYYGGDGGGILDHHIYPTGRRNFDLHRWCHFGKVQSDINGETPSGMNMNINMNFSQSGPSATSYPWYASGTDYAAVNNYILVDSNDFANTQNALDGGTGGDSLSQLGYGDNYIVQDNAFHDFRISPHINDMLQGVNIKQFIVRDNIFYNVGRSIIYFMDSIVLEGRMYRNKAGTPLANNNLMSLGGRLTFPNEVLVDTYVSTINNYTYNGQLIVSSYDQGTPYVPVVGNISIDNPLDALSGGSPHPLGDRDLPGGAGTLEVPVSSQKWTIYDNEFYVSGAEERGILAYYASDTGVVGASKTDGTYNFTKNLFWSPGADYTFYERHQTEANTGITLTDFNTFFNATGDNINTSADPGWFDIEVGDFSVSGA